MDARPHASSPAATAAVRALAAASGSPTLLAAAAAGDASVDPALDERAGTAVAALSRPLGPEHLGAVYETLLAPEHRDAGAHYTAPDVARSLVDRAAPTSWLAAGPRTVWDPACGGGAFLLAAADALLAAGHAPERIVGGLLWGTDLDPGAVVVSRAALAWWAERHGAPADAVAVDQVVVADTLLDPAGCPPAPVDLVVGNPPFQGQLSGGTVRSTETTAALRDRWGGVVGPYTDTAAVFLVAGVRALAPGGALVLVLPLSALAARDAAAARRAATTDASLVGLWVAGEPVFDAEVEVCAPVLRRLAEDAVVAPPQRWSGRAFRSIDGDLPPRSDDRSGRRRVSDVVSAVDDASWAVHALAALGVPDPRITSDGTLGEIARTAAGFRDEYYGLVGHVVEAPEGVHPDDVDWPSDLVALVTTGLIDVATSGWGIRDARFAGVRYRRPAVERRGPASETRAGTWLAASAAPKVLVATQTRVGEAIVDARGTCVGSTPVVAAFAPAARLWEVAAVVCSPVGSVVALARSAGTGRTARTVRHTTRTVADLPLPVDHAAWRAGAAALRSGDRPGFLAAMADAYRLDPVEARELADWWTALAPPPPTDRP